MTLPENIATVNRLRIELESFRPLSKEAADKLWQKLRLEWNYNSNHIEGNTLTYGETMLLLLHDKTTGDHAKREYDEMQAHDVAIHMVREWADDTERELSEADIRTLNRIILVKPYWKDAITAGGQETRREIKIGEYKEYPNSVRLKNGEIFHYASPGETPLKMRELIEWYRSKKDEHPAIIAAELHYQFVRIHPFDDGNGRVARLLVNYVLMKGGYPPIVIKSNDKESYLTALQKADAGDHAAFLDYIAQQMIWSLELETKAANGEGLEEADDIDKEIALLKKEMHRTNKISVTGKKNNIYHFIQDSVAPMFELFDKRTKELEDFFLENERIIFFDIDKGGVSPFTGDGKIEEAIQRVLSTARSKDLLFKKISYHRTFTGLKTTTNALQISLKLEVTFDSYNVRIQTPDMKQPVLFAYGKVMSNEERAAIVNPIVWNVVDRIKRGQ